VGWGARNRLDSRNQPFPQPPVLAVTLGGLACSGPVSPEKQIYRSWQLSARKIARRDRAIMRIFTPCSVFLSPKDVRLISSIVRGYHALPVNPPALRKGWSRCRSPAATLSRGAKTKATKKLKELHQGVIAAGPLPELDADDAPQYPTVIQGAKNNMMKFNNCVLITRVGNFYEVRSPYDSHEPALKFDSYISITPNSTRLS
jgi:hypothetical protein